MVLLPYYEKFNLIEEVIYCKVWEHHSSRSTEHENSNGDTISPRPTTSTTDKH